MKNKAISYRTLLGKRGFAGLLFAVSIGRLASGLIPFGLMAIFAQGEKFMLAGTVSAIFMLVTALSGPWRGRCVDQYSARRVLPLLAGASVTAIALGFAAFHFVADAWVGTALVCLGAAVAPVNGAVVRSIWSLIAPDEAERKALHALDSLAEESIHVLSPLIVAALWLFVGTDWAIFYLFMPGFVGLFTLPMFFSNWLLIAGSVALLIGLVLTPMFIAAYVGIPNSFKKENFNEANASIGAAYNLGSGSGAMLAGVLVEQMSIRTSFLGSVTLPLVATITAATFARIAMYSRK